MSFDATVENKLARLLDAIGDDDIIHDRYSSALRLLQMTLCLEKIVLEHVRRRLKESHDDPYGRTPGLVAATGHVSNAVGALDPAGSERRHAAWMKRTSFRPRKR